MIGNGKNKSLFWLGFRTTLNYRNKVHDYVENSKGRWTSVAHLMREGINRFMDAETEKNA